MPEENPKPPARPSNKVTAGVAAAGIMGGLVWVLKTFYAVDMDAVTAVGLTGTVTFITQYIVRDSE